MALATKEMEEENKHSECVEDRNINTNGVVITVYVESVTTRSEDPIKKTKPHPHFRRPRVSGTQGYDRRAQLLAHCRQLRNEGSENVTFPTNQSQTRTTSKKGVWVTQPVRICSCYPSTHTRPCSSSRSRYERVASKESEERNQSEKKKSNGKDSPPILRKVKNMLKELSCKEI